MRISHVNVGRVGTLAYNSFRWTSIRLFNCSPMHLRSVFACSVLKFKKLINSELSVVVYPLAWRIFPACQDSTTAWMVEIVDVGLPVMAWLSIRCSWANIIIRKASISITRGMKWVVNISYLTLGLSSVTF